MSMYELTGDNFKDEGNDSCILNFPPSFQQHFDSLPAPHGWHGDVLCYLCTGAAVHIQQATSHPTRNHL